MCVALTNRLLELVWWPEQTNLKSLTSNDTNVSYDILTIISLMNTEIVSQSWFRFFHVIGKPIEFCDSVHTSKLLEFVRVSRMHKEIENLSSISQFTCIKKLPMIFLEVLKGISRIVDAFLGYTASQQNAHNQPLNHQKLSAAALNSLNANLTNSSQPTEQRVRSKSTITHTTSNLFLIQ